MREIFSLRFFAAIGAVIASFLIASAVVGGGAEVVSEEEVTAQLIRRVDLVERVERFQDDGASFAVQDGVAVNGTVPDPGRQVRSADTVEVAV